MLHLSFFYYITFYGCRHVVNAFAIVLALNVHDQSPLINFVSYSTFLVSLAFICHVFAIVLALNVHDQSPLISFVSYSTFLASLSFICHVFASLSVLLTPFTVKISFQI